MPLLTPVFIILFIWAYQYLAHLLPDRQRAVLDQVVRLAVRQVEQTMNGEMGNIKKMAAIELVKRLFTMLRLPAPADFLIDVAIEAAVYELKHLKEGE